MKILHLACLNNDPEIQPNMGPKCIFVGGEPHFSKLLCDLTKIFLHQQTYGRPHKGYVWCPLSYFVLFLMH